MHVVGSLACWQLRHDGLRITSNSLHSRNHSVCNSAWLIHGNGFIVGRVRLTRRVGSVHAWLHTLYGLLALLRDAHAAVLQLPAEKRHADCCVWLGGTERTPFSSACALRMSAEGLAEPQPQRRRTVMIPSIDAWRPPLSMRSSKESSRFFSVRAVAPPNLIDKKSCEQERCTMRMGAAAQCCRRGAVVRLYGQRGPPPCSRPPPDSCVFTW